MDNLTNKCFKCLSELNKDNFLEKKKFCNVCSKKKPVVVEQNLEMKKELLLKKINQLEKKINNLKNEFNKI